MTPANDFTKHGYRDVLSRLLQRGYNCRSYDDVRKDRADLIVRHDIDFSPADALPIAAIEQKLGVFSTYFFLARSPFYSLDDQATRTVFGELFSRGHDVGLHFDAARYADDETVLEQAALDECELLERYTDRPVRVISFHRPAAELLNRSSTIAGRLHTYQPAFFKEIGYCSDSSGRWRHGHPLNHAAVAEGHALQLLTHPIWWANDDAGNREQALDRLAKQYDPSIRLSIAETVTGYDAQSGRIVE